MFPLARSSLLKAPSLTAVAYGLGLNDEVVFHGFHVRSIGKKRTNAVATVAR